MKKQRRDYLSGENPEYTCQFLPANLPSQAATVISPFQQYCAQTLKTPTSSLAAALQNKSKRNGMVEPECLNAPVHFFCTNHLFNVSTLAQRSIFMCLYISFSDYSFVLENICNSAPFGCVLDQIFSKGDHIPNCIKELLWLFKELTTFSV